MGRKRREEGWDENGDPQDGAVGELSRGRTPIAATTVGKVGGQRVPPAPPFLCQQISHPERSGGD